MAALGSPALAISESLFILRRFSSDAAITGLTPDLFDATRGARLEQAFSDKLRDFMTNTRRGDFGASVSEINNLLMTDPVIAQKFARPWNDKLGISLKDATEKGMVVPGSSPPHVRIFFQIDEGGYVYQTTPQGERMNERGQLGNIYEGLEGPHSFALIIRDVIARKAEKKLGDGVIKNIVEMDSVFDQASRDGKNGQEFYADLNKMSDTELGALLKSKITAAYSMQNFTPTPAPDGEKPEAAAARVKADREREEAVNRANVDLATRNLERETQYLNLIRMMGTLNPSDRGSVLDLVDMKRAPDVLLSGFVREGLSLGTGLGYARPWGNDGTVQDMTHGRLWDKVGFGQIYEAMFTDGEYDLRIAARVSLSKDGLIEGCAKDPGFQGILKRMDLPDPLNNRDIQKISVALYAYEVLKNEGFKNFEDRVAGIYSGQGQLTDAERLAVINAMQGIPTNSTAPVVPNTRYDMPLFKYTYIANDPFLKDEPGVKHPADVNREWFNNEFGDKNGSTLTPQLTARNFWHNNEARYLGFPVEFIQREIDPSTIEAMKGVPGLENVKQGMKYEDLNPDQTVALFHLLEKIEPDEYPPGTGDNAAEAMDKVGKYTTAVEVWDSPGGKTRHAHIFASAQRRQVMDAVADGHDPVVPGKRADADMMPKVQFAANAAGVTEPVVPAALEVPDIGFDPVRLASGVKR